MLIALTGLTGSGKSTAIEHWVGSGIGKCYYAGAVIHDEVVARGLAATPDNERIVRQSLREKHGMAVVASRAAPKLAKCCDHDNFFLDAIYNVEELECYRQHLGKNLKLISISAKPEVRYERLAVRQDRPISSDKAKARDDYEINKLDIGSVMSEADLECINEASLLEFKQSLDILIAKIL